MTTIDTTIVATALDTLQRELGTTVNWISWTMTAYSLGFVLMLPLSAKLAKVYGPRRIFVLSILIFTVFSWFCGWTKNIEQLVVLRFFQAVGSAGITPSVTAIIVNHFGRARDRAVSLFGSIFPIGILLGPIFGGFIVTYWTWPWIFYVNVPLGICVLLMTFIFIPKDQKNRATNRSKIDWKGLLWLATGILSLMLAVTQVGERNFNLLSPVFIGLSILSLLGFYGFIKHINRTAQPFIAPLFVYGKGFGVVNFLNLSYSGMTQGMVALVPLFALNRYQIEEIESAILLVAQGVASIIMSTLVSFLLRKTGYRIPFFFGSLLIVTGLFLLAFPSLIHVSPYYGLMGATFLIGLGTGAISPPARNAGLQLAPKESATIAALRSLCIQFGSIISIALATAVIATADHKGEVQALVYLSTSVLFAILLPLIIKIPEHKGSW